MENKFKKVIAEKDVHICFGSLNAGGECFTSSWEISLASKR